MSYTKGEWKTEKQIETGYNEIVSGAVSIGIIHGDNNARLISAAPDLLEALKRLTRVASVELGKTRPDVIEQAKQSIAKAEGK